MLLAATWPLMRASIANNTQKLYTLTVAKIKQSTDERSAEEGQIAEGDFLNFHQSEKWSLKSTSQTFAGKSVRLVFSHYFYSV
jgi:hypothetical protein